ncbi:hypothetical protein WK26_11300 [Burkholderia vietnamiensis]|nr:hypothetical protein WK26_11300 [Burkholderia vietnamiensis]
MNDISSLLMFLIATSGGGLASQPAHQPAYWRPVVTSRSFMRARTDFVVCKDGRFHSFDAGQPKPCN